MSQLPTQTHTHHSQFGCYRFSEHSIDMEEIFGGFFDLLDCQVLVVNQISMPFASLGSRTCRRSYPRQVGFVIDVFSRLITGWQTATTMTTVLVLDALEHGGSTRNTTGWSTWPGWCATMTSAAQYTSARYVGKQPDHPQRSLNQVSISLMNAAFHSSRSRPVRRALDDMVHWILTYCEISLDHTVRYNLILPRFEYERSAIKIVEMAQCSVRDEIAALFLLHFD